MPVWPVFSAQLIYMREESRHLLFSWFSVLGRVVWNHERHEDQVFISHAMRRKEHKKKLCAPLNYGFSNANWPKNANVSKGKCLVDVHAYCTAFYWAVWFHPAWLCSAMCCFISFYFLPYSCCFRKWGASSCVCLRVCVCGAQEWSPLPQHPVT